MAYRNTYLSVNLDHLNHNYQIYKEFTDKDVFAVVKANAYGTGLIESAKAFESFGAPYLCTATFEEAVQLREASIKTPILVMGYTRLEDLKIAKEKDITITVVSLDYAKAIDVEGLKLHLKVNTSMNRLGHNNSEEINESINLLKNDHIIEGIFTHYATCIQEVCDQDFKKFKDITKHSMFKFKYIHASSSRSALYYSESYTNAVRIGIGLYGGIDDKGLKHVVSLYSEVVSLRSIKANEKVSYEGNYTASKDAIIATLPIGYADGILRSDTGHQVLINNKKYPIVGNVCMDQLMLEVDDDVSLFDKVELFGSFKTIQEIATRRNTINYEVLTTISNRVERIYTKK